MDHQQRGSRPLHSKIGNDIRNIFKKTTGHTFRCAPGNECANPAVATPSCHWCASQVGPSNLHKRWRSFIDLRIDVLTHLNTVHSWHSRFWICRLPCGHPPVHQGRRAGLHGPPAAALMQWDALRFYLCNPLFGHTWEPSNVSKSGTRHSSRNKPVKLPTHVERCRTWLCVLFSLANCTRRSSSSLDHSVAGFGPSSTRSPVSSTTTLVKHSETGEREHGDSGEMVWNMNENG